MIDGHDDGNEIARDLCAKRAPTVGMVSVATKRTKGATKMGKVGALTVVTAGVTKVK